ncbi:MAG: ParA family protein, partial [Eubacteriales bacterium]
MQKKLQLTVVCGHYGCGKTNLALNLALEAAQEGGQVTVVDMDIVNPYFRSSEYGELLESRGIRLIAPVFAGTTLDTPTLPPEIYSIFEGGGQVFLDVGGDDAGITALGGLHEQMEAAGYEMLYVINRYRVLSQKPEEAAALLREIESASRLKATGLVNNSHLGVETKLSTVLDSM